MSVKIRFVALGVASLLVLLLWFGVVYHPASAKLGKLKQDITAAQTQRSQLQAELQRLQTLKANEPLLRADVAKFTAAMPTSPQISAFIRLVQNAADGAGIDFLSVAPSLPAAAQPAAAPAAPAPATSPAPSSTPAPTTSTSGTAPTSPTLTTTASGIQVITISLTAKGNFFPMEDFLHRLEHLPRALRVTTFSVSGGQASTPGSAPAANSGGLSVSMSLSIFVAPPAAAGPSVATSPAPGA
jgi:Tfp pilus assembly protein PilO